MKNLTYILLFISCSLTAQENVSVSLCQDAKLAFVGDDIGNDAFTTDVIIRLNLKGSQDKIGYGYMFPEFEFANLKGANFNKIALETAIGRKNAR